MARSSEHAREILQDKLEPLPGFLGTAWSRTDDGGDVLVALITEDFDSEQLPKMIEGIPIQPLLTGVPEAELDQ
jgi:hypothetical protein